MATKIRTLEQLIDFLSQESQPRQQELITLKLMINNSRDHQKSVLSRSTILVAYAHWEGFIEKSSIAYISFVEFKSLRFEELSLNFKALVYKRKMLAFGSIPQKISHYFSLLDVDPSPVNLDPQKLIETKSNLNFENFENICKSVGINHQVYWSSYKPFIDELVSHRCSIAHGSLESISVKYINEIIEKVSQFITRYKDDLENLACQQAYQQKSLESLL